MVLISSEMSCEKCTGHWRRESNLLERFVDVFVYHHQLGKENKELIEFQYGGVIAFSSNQKVTRRPPFEQSFFQNEF